MSKATGAPHGEPHEPHGQEQSDLTIEELARIVGMTPRNIRAHQSRGLVHRPTMRGRTGYYDGTHLSRLVLIKELQERGLNLRAIGAALRGNDPVSSILQALRSSRQGTEPPDARVMLPASSVRRLREVEASVPDELCDYGLLERGSDGTYTADAVQFAAGARLFEAGMLVADMVRAQFGVVRNARETAGTVVRSLLAQEGGDAERVREVLAEVTPYAVQLFTSAFESTLEAALREKPGDEEPVTRPRR